MIKQRLRYVLLSLLILPMLSAPAFVLAEGAGSNSSNTSSNTSHNTASSDDKRTSTETPNTSTEDKPKTTTTPEDSPNTTDMDKRLTKLKGDLKINLTATQQEHIKTRCKPAQGIVKSVGDKVDTGVTNRSQAYVALTDKLTSLVAKLQAKNVDTTAFQSEITVLQTKIASFTTDLTAYRQTLSDLKGVDCVTDPAAFQGALTASRTAHDKLITDVANIKAYVSGTIKPTLQAIRTVLEAQEKTAATSSNSEGTH